MIITSKCTKGALCERYIWSKIKNNPMLDQRQKNKKKLALNRSKCLPKTKPQKKKKKKKSLSLIHIHIQWILIITLTYQFPTLPLILLYIISVPKLANEVLQYEQVSFRSDQYPVDIAKPKMVPMAITG